MIPAANVLTDLYLSAAALIGLSLLHMTLDREDPLSRRFVFGVRVTMLLFLGRALVVLTGGAAFQFLVMLAAGLIPLAVLLLTEGLLRQHAPAWAKGLGVGGVVVFSILAFLPPAWVDPLRLTGLFLFQIGIFGICGWLVVSRDKQALSGAENVAVERLALSLILFIPMIGADFGAILIGLPVQVSAIGVLTLCWLALTLGNDTEGQRATVMTFLSAVFVAFCAGGLLGTISGAGRNGWVLSIAIVLSAILLVMIAIDARRQRAAKQSLTILRHLATGPIEDPITFLQGLQGFPRVEGAAIIEADKLADLQPALLNAVFEKRPVLRKSDPAPEDENEAEYVSHLFDQFAASHILRVSRSPLRLLAIAIPALTSSPQSELEVDVVQRMASLIAERGT